MSRELESAVALWKRLKPPKSKQGQDQNSLYVINMEQLYEVLGNRGLKLLRGAPDDLICKSDMKLAGDSNFNNAGESKVAASTSPLERKYSRPYAMPDRTLVSRSLDTLMHIVSTSQSWVGSASDLRRIISLVLNIADMDNEYCFLKQKNRDKLIQSIDEEQHGKHRDLGCSEPLRQHSSGRCAEQDKRARQKGKMAPSCFRACPLHTVHLNRS